MLKERETPKEVELEAARALKLLISRVPSIKLDELELQPGQGPKGVPDFIADLTVDNRHHKLVCEVKANGQPKSVRLALMQLGEYLEDFGDDATPLLIAPYLSPEAQALCVKHHAGFLDFQGNARLVFDGVFIERQVPDKPVAEKRELKSLFKPKSAQVLRVMLRDPERVWRVEELAKASGVSLGHVSNVRSALLDREWAALSPNGMSLARPASLLDMWRSVYAPPAGKRNKYYTTLHGGGLEEKIKNALRGGDSRGRAVFASFSAAHWLEPYGRTGLQYLYADAEGSRRLAEALKLSSSPKGENVVIDVLSDEGPLRDAIEPAPGVFCTSPVQTYLDLSAAGERGREAADHLREMRLKWPK